MYKITDYSYKQADKLGVSIKPSTNKKKKIDVFKQDKKIASIGANSYPDYPTYIKTKGKEYADERRRLFKARFKESAKKVGSNAFWASNLLW